MNAERILLLADRLENLPDPEAFDMHTFHHEDGTPSCFAGFTVDEFAPDFDMVKAFSSELLTKASELLALPENDGMRLFMPGQYGQGRNPYTITNREGAAVLRHYAAIGEIRFDIADCLKAREVAR